MDDRFLLLRSLKRSGWENGKKKLENYSNGIRHLERLPASHAELTGTTTAPFYTLDRGALREDLEDLLWKRGKPHKAPMRALVTLMPFERREGREGRRCLAGGTQTPSGVGCCSDGAIVVIAEYGRVWQGGDRMSSKISPASTGRGCRSRFKTSDALLAEAKSSSVLEVYGELSPSASTILGAANGVNLAESTTVASAA